eukprot:COSAG02_NODE_9_length_59728_cov_36.104714_72_plen_93_part_00
MRRTLHQSSQKACDAPVHQSLRKYHVEQKPISCTSTWARSRRLVCVGSTEDGGNELVNRVGILVDAGFPVLVGARNLTGIPGDVILSTIITQ